MKVNVIDEYNAIVFFNRYYTKNMDFKNREELEEHFHTLFLKLKENYNLDIKGYYNIDVYLDTYYGAIIALEKEDLDYIEYFDNQVDMRVNILDDECFLYEVEDLFLLSQEIRKKSNIYYNKKFYIEIKQELTPYQMGNLLENSTLIYGNKAAKIKLRSKKIKYQEKITTL